MTFPSLASLDALIFPALTTSNEKLSVHRTRDGVETSITALYDDVELEPYTEGGTTVTAHRRELTILRAQVTAPTTGDRVTLPDGTRWELQQQLAKDSSITRWFVTPLTVDGT